MLHRRRFRTTSRSVVKPNEARERDGIDEGPAGGGHGALHVRLGHTEEVRDVLQRDLEGREVHAAAFHMLALRTPPATFRRRQHRHTGVERIKFDIRHTTHLQQQTAIAMRRSGGLGRVAWSMWQHMATVRLGGFSVGQPGRRGRQLATAAPWSS